jgi:hypothetical protein
MRRLLFAADRARRTMEIAPITQQLDDLQQRVEALRGYL